MSDVIERMARAIWQAREQELEPRLRREPDDMDEVNGNLQAVRAMARAAWLVAREECAKVADGMKGKSDESFSYDSGWNACAESGAAAIRAMGG